MNRIALLSLISTSALSVLSAQNKKALPNVIFIMADDLGYADVGFNGQRLIRTPHLDSLARAGMQFSDFYAGCSVSAPSRASLMTGMHTGHTQIRGNKEIKPEGQSPVADRMTLGRLFQGAGYRTGIFGKWGLGYPGSGAEATDRGFDEFFGYNCQRMAHIYYPDHLWHGKERVDYPTNVDGQHGVYSADEIHREALRFIETSAKDNVPFFAMLTYTLPHAELNLPHDAVYEYYEGKLIPKPYESRYKWDYPSSPNAHAAFAAMVERLDRYTGEVGALLRRLGIEEHTLVIFTSDNGPHREGGADPDYFDSNGIYRGIKRDLYEGGIRIPMAMAWKGKIAPGGKSQVPLAFWDFLPTFAELIGQGAKAKGSDGKSFLSILKGATPSKSLASRPLYWEFHEDGGKMALRKGEWKLIALKVDTGSPVLELYNLASDPSETKDLSASEPKRREQLYREMLRMRTSSTDFPFAYEVKTQIERSAH